MSARSKLRLRVWNGAEAGIAEVPLSSETISLRCMAGAAGVHVVLSDDHGVRLRAEIGAEPGELVPLHVQLDESSAPQLRSHGRNVFILPSDARYDPPLPIRPAAPDAPLDIALVVDGTTRLWRQPESTQSAHLLDNKAAWGEHVEKLLAFIEDLAQGRQSRIAVLAFGDQELPGVTAHDLRPRYRVLPAADEQILQPYDARRLKEKLLAIPATPGGDFVDALADALGACTQLRWAAAARRLLIVTGDSPGCSLLHPLPKGADLCVRERDVDTQAVQLHRQQVEVMTLYHGPETDAPHWYAIAYQRELLLAAKAQYTRLASTSAMAFEASSFDPAEAAMMLHQKCCAIGREMTVGELATA